MGRYRIRLAIIFTTLFLILSIILVLFYMSITRNFISSRAEESFRTYNLGISTRVEVTLNQTYDTFKEMVDEYRDQSLNPVIQLNALDAYDLVVEKSNTGYTVNGTFYSYSFERI